MPLSFINDLYRRERLTRIREAIAGAKRDLESLSKTHPTAGNGDLEACRDLSAAEVAIERAIKSGS